MAEILIADDHELVRDTIAAYLSATGDFNVQTASSLDEAHRVLSEVENVDLAILDYMMPGMDGLSGLVATRQRFPTVKLALMSGVATPDVASEAIDLGASGYFPKSRAVQTLVAGINRVLAGEKHIDLKDAGVRTETQAGAESYNLTQRETEILEALAKGISNKAIASQFGLKEVTVKFHISNVMSKLGVSNRTQAALLARERRII